MFFFFHEKRGPKRCEVYREFRTSTRVSCNVIFVVAPRYIVCTLSISPLCLSFGCAFPLFLVLARVYVAVCLCVCVYWFPMNFSVRFIWLWCVQAWERCSYGKMEMKLAIAWPLTISVAIIRGKMNSQNVFNSPEWKSQKDIFQVLWPKCFVQILSSFDIYIYTSFSHAHGTKIYQ